MTTGGCRWNWAWMRTRCARCMAATNCSVNFRVSAPDGIPFAPLLWGLADGLGEGSRAWEPAHGQDVVESGGECEHFNHAFMVTERVLLS